MKGVPASFTVEDELYYLNAEAEKVPQGTSPIEVLAETSPSVKFMKPHPAVWITSHPTARIVGITLGHDQRGARSGRVQDAPRQRREVGRSREAVTPQGHGTSAGAQETDSSTTEPPKLKSSGWPVFYGACCQTPLPHSS